MTTFHSISFTFTSWYLVKLGGAESCVFGGRSVFKLPATHDEQGAQPPVLAHVLGQKVHGLRHAEKGGARGKRKKKDRVSVTLRRQKKKRKRKKEKHSHRHGDKFLKFHETAATTTRKDKGIKLCGVGLETVAQSLDAVHAETAWATQHSAQNVLGRLLKPVTHGIVKLLVPTEHQK